MTTTSLRLDRARGCLIGLALGDSLGRLVETSPSTTTTDTDICSLRQLGGGGDNNNSNNNNNSPAPDPSETPPLKDIKSVDRHQEASAYANKLLSAVNNSKKSITLACDEVLMKEGFAPPLLVSDGFQWGQVTDDTQLTMSLAQAIIATSINSVDPEHGSNPLASSYEDGVGSRFSRCLIERLEHGCILGIGLTTRDAIINLRQGHLWRTAGGDQNPSNGAAMRVAPVAIAASTHKQVVRDAILSCLPTHRHPDAIAAAVALACACRYLLTLETDSHHNDVATTHFNVDLFLQHILTSITSLPESSSLPPTSSTRLHDTLNRLPRLLTLPLPQVLQELAELDPRNPNHSPVHGISGDACVSLTFAIYAFLKHPNSFPHAVCLAISAGGDTDTMACMTGALSGAYLGEQGVPRMWADQVHDALVEIMLDEDDPRRKIFKIDRAVIVALADALVQVSADRPT